MASTGQRLALKSLGVIAILLALLFGGAGITALAAQNALPGDSLYPIKTTLEQTRLRLATDDAGQAELHLEFAQRRLDELAGLIAAGRLNSTSQVAAEFEFHLEKAIASFRSAASGDPVVAQEMAGHIAAALSRYAQTLGTLMANAPETTRPALTRAINVANELISSGQGSSKEIEFTGAVESKQATSWTVGGRTVAISAQTEIKGAINEGDIVKVHALVAADGGLTAREIELAREDVRQDEIEFSGVVEAMATNSWTVGGRTVAISAQTEIKGAIKVGDIVKVHALVAADGGLTAREIELAREEVRQDETRFSGVVEAISTTAWTVGGRTVAVGAQTRFDGAIKVGDLVEVRALVAPDGSLTAREIKLERVEQRQVQEVRATGRVEAIGASSWTVDGQAFAITPQTEVRGFIRIGDLVEVRAQVAPDGGLTAFRIDLKEQQEEAEVRFSGTVEAINGETWTISGRPVRVVALLTDVRDFIQVGDRVEVRALLDLDGVMVALRIERED